MTVAQIIGEIGSLPDEDRKKVLRFTRRLESEVPLSADELTALAAELASCEDKTRGNALQEQIVKGFYGKE